MLTEPYRLTEKRDFKRVIEHGRSFFIKEFGIKSVPRKRELPYRAKRGSRDAKRPTRIGIVVPKKITKIIVKRNRIKRQVRHIFLGLIADLAPGYDIVFFARPDFLKLEFKEMEEKIVSVLKRIRLLGGGI
jgi:ribonuclease P protein component